MSDHLSIFCQLQFLFDDDDPGTIYKRAINDSINYMFCERLLMTNWGEILKFDYVNSVFDVFMKYFRETYNKCFPFQK